MSVTPTIFSPETKTVICRYQCIEMPLAPIIVDPIHHMTTTDVQLDGLSFRDRTHVFLERITADNFYQLASWHPTRLLNRHGILLNGRTTPTLL